MSTLTHDLAHLTGLYYQLPTNLLLEGAPWYLVCLCAMETNNAVMETHHPPGTQACRAGGPSCGLVALLLLFFTSSAVARFENDKQALLALKEVIDPDNTLATWTPDNPLCIMWEGITCYPSNKTVVGIDIRDVFLGGQLADDEDIWQQLSLLTYINLGNTSLTGELPPAMANATALQSIVLANNQLNGVFVCLFVFLGGADRCLTLCFVMGVCSLCTLTYPKCLYTLDMLACTMRVVTTQCPLCPPPTSPPSRFSPGTIPQSWQALSSLETLDLSDNRLTGHVPLGWMGQLVLLDLAFNDLDFNDLHPHAQEVNWGVMESLQFVYVGGLGDKGGHVVGGGGGGAVWLVYVGTGGRSDCWCVKVVVPCILDVYILDVYNPDVYILDVYIPDVNIPNVYIPCSQYTQGPVWKPTAVCGW